MYSLQVICLITYLWSFLHIIACKQLKDSSLALNEVAYHDEPSQIYLGSPSIVRLSSDTKKCFSLY